MYHYDSRKIQPGDIFICLPGGEPYISQARDRGAIDILKMGRADMAKLAADLAGAPSRKLTVIGITGTNGKTTVANLVNDCLLANGIQAQYLGTINSTLTTPESLDIQRIMAEHVAAGGTHFVMEVSSHGIHQNRIGEIDFNIKALTNITQDHLGYHKTFENYKNTKLAFMKDSQAICIFPEDYKKITIDFPISLLGHFNYENVQTAVAILRAVGINNEKIKEFMQKAKAPAGRFEPVYAGQQFLALVDFAHTPDALENVLKTARPLAAKNSGKVLLLFGCGGDRDRSKRPEMAKIAQKLADYFIITQDNPRTENEAQIISDILAGITVAADKYKVISDRRLAIKELVKTATPKDVLIVAGKGHETYQILGTRKIHFDDREELKKAIKAECFENSI